MLRLAAAIVFVGVLCGSAQERDASSNVQLRLHPKSTLGAIPQAFEFEIVNADAGDIRIPTPAVHCFSRDSGSLVLHVRFTPRSGRYGPSSGHGCGGGVYDGPTVLERAKTWKILPPGQRLRIVASKNVLFYEDNHVGTYEFWATYSPPTLSVSERKLLRDAGITTAEGETTSAHITFVKSR